MALFPVDDPRTDADEASADRIVAVMDQWVK
jgi:hypothetical protein